MSKMRSIHSPHKRHGNTPAYLRSEVSASFLSKNPQYKNHFKKCPKCSKYSFKPVNANQLGKQERRCLKCGYFNDSVPF